MRQIAWVCLGFFGGLALGGAVDWLYFGIPFPVDALGYGVLGAILGASVNDFGYHDVSARMLARIALLGFVVTTLLGAVFQQLTYGQILPSTIGHYGLLGAVVAVNATLVMLYRRGARRHRR